MIGPLPACRFAAPATVNGPLCEIPLLCTVRFPVMLLVPSVSKPALVTEALPLVSDSEPVRLFPALVITIAPVPAMMVKVVPPGSTTAPPTVTSPLPVVVLMMLLLPTVNPPEMVKAPLDVSVLLSTTLPL